MNSRDKGARGEREWAAKLKAHGVEASRGAQHRGGPHSPDVITPEDHPFHWEVKWNERLRLHRSMAQAIYDCPSHKVPALAHRRNHGDWLVTMRADDLLRLVLGRDTPEITAIDVLSFCAREGLTVVRA